VSLDENYMQVLEDDNWNVQALISIEQVRSAIEELGISFKGWQ
jgi:hypothetical protein